MILEEIEVKERIESPSNLLNRLKSQTNRLAPIPSIPCSVNDVIKDVDEKLSFGSAKSKAAGIMNAAMDELRVRLPEVQRPEKLAAIAAEMGKIINNTQIRTENDMRIGQIIVYAPRLVSESSFEVVDALDMQA